MISPTFADQIPHALLPVEDDEAVMVETRYRSFPFKPGALPTKGHERRADDALIVFSVLHEAVKAGRLTFEQLQPLFFRSTSDLVTYREGWKAGKFWSRDAWQTAVRNKHTNGLISEHVLPRSAALKHALKLDIDEALAFVKAKSFECVVTKAENKALNAVKAAFPDDPWRRYALAGIKVLDVRGPNGVSFLDETDRAELSRHGILVEG
ncbi:MAG: hypothetical protein QM742_08435 [Aquabacterium sp.]